MEASDSIPIVLTAGTQENDNPDPEPPEEPRPLPYPRLEIIAKGMDENTRLCILEITEDIGRLKYTIPEGTIFPEDTLQLRSVGVDQGRIRFSRMQLEEGTVVSDWHPNETDFASSTQVEQLSDAVSLYFSTMNRDFDTIFSHIRFIDDPEDPEYPAIILGRAETNITLIIGRERIKFVAHYGTDEEEVIASFTGNSMEIVDLSRVQFGNFGFLPRPSGNLTFTKVVY